MKKGITPIVATIILLLITVALAGLAWTFLSQYYGGLTNKNIQVTDSYCLSGLAKVSLRNIGSATISLGGCTAAAGVSGQSTQCGDVTITKTGGLPAAMSGNTSAATISSQGSVTFTDVCTASNTCVYRVTTGSGIGPNVVSVTC